MRIVQGPRELALQLDATHRAVPLSSAPDLDFPCVGWWSAARDPEAAALHPEWMHAPQHHEWLRLFPDYAGGHPALVWPWIGLGTRAPFDHELARFVAAAKASPYDTILLADIQGPPMGCGCGNPSCRSWDNAPGEKVAPSPYEVPEVLFPLEFFRAARRALPGRRLIPILCPECERGIELEGVADPDGPEGTNLCQGVGCVYPCSTEYWPRLLEAFRHETDRIGLLLTVDGLERNHPVYGEPRAWAHRAHRHYGLDLTPCVEPVDAPASGDWIVLATYDQSCRPVAPPPGYEPSVPPIRCGLC